MSTLLLGPLLRHVGERDATVWVETDTPCMVEIRAGDVVARARTFAVAGHHYALVVVDGLPAGTSTPYQVQIDDRIVWPLPDNSFPPSRIRTIDPRRPIHLVFGSCREPVSAQDRRAPALDPDVLDAYALRMTTQDQRQWPDLLLLVGDQIYADDTSPVIQDAIRAVRDIRRPPGSEVANFEEYTWLYREAWSDPALRWLLSTLPSSMIFDDHDVRDDWNTSHAWRRTMQRTDWWEERITGALMSYWIYQHLGNCSPAELDADPLYASVRAAADAEPILRAFARAADKEADGAKGFRWSYRRDFGPVRLIVIDSRCGRILAGGRRLMIGDAEAAWLEDQVRTGDFEHLVVVSSLPWLLPRALHDLESWDEALARGVWGRSIARMAEWLRQAIDLEHWAAFRTSFDWLAGWFRRIGSGEAGGSIPATICVLSGDVHHSYVSEAEFQPPLGSRVYQLTCSPIHNGIPQPMRLVFHLGWSDTVTRITRLACRWARVPPLPIHWHHPTGPHFGNTLTEITFDGRSARCRLEHSVMGRAEDGHEDEPTLELTAELTLAETEGST